ncbi:formamidopyrimidine-DNA glycosylase [bacterium]|nr:formamidopyrimidine-DNA glycosylase [bacterium]
MPELPDITVYIERLRPRVEGRVVRDIELRSPFLLRSVDPPLAEFVGQPVRGFRRLGKRIVWCFDDERFLILHLMIAGRLYWKPPGAKVPGKVGLAAFHFDSGTLTLTEASSKKRASLHTARGAAALARHDPGGLDVLTADLAAFTAVLARENHTLKRALTDPRLFDGIGNAFSDEILHAARLSPLALTRGLKPDAVARLFEAARATLTDWTERLRAEVGDGFPEKVTAFRDGMAVHGRFGKPCPACGAEVQRVRYAENETNYCPGCQTCGRLLADRALSRLLKDDWPRTQEELEEIRRGPGP